MVSLMEIDYKKYNPSNSLEKQLFQYFWDKYISELKVIDKTVSLTSESGNIMAEYDDTTVYLMVADRNPCGFFIIGKKPANCPESCDYYIQEFYVLDKYQKKGIGKEIMKKFLSTHGGRYFLYILKNNERAIGFWNKVAVENNVIAFRPDEEIKEYEECLWLTFKTRPIKL